MRWCLLAAVVFGLSISDVASQAQGPPDGQRLSLSRSTSQDAGFFATTGVVRFQLIQGRLCLDPPRHRKGSQSRDQDGVYESITVTAERGIPSLHYVCQTESQHLILSVQQAGYVRIESYFPRTAHRSVLDQPEIGPVTWKVVRGDLDEEYHGATLLHLRQSNPVTFDEHYGLLMQRLLRGQSMEELCGQTQVAMLRQAGHADSPDRQSILAAFDQLRSSKRARRIAAERQLISWGTPIIPIVQSIPRRDMDPEQSDRLRQILRRLRRPVNDTPASLAMLLVNDRNYWSLIASRLTRDQIQSANHHLEVAGLASIALDTGPLQRVARQR
ncbi:MAG: hypothetical protein MI861_06835 [Pirellulales bacterium]|nr:hypothetical protein [Pirellulales bacterium]